MVRGFLSLHRNWNAIFSKVKVHQCCYGYNNTSPRSWLCRTCKQRKRDLKCEICLRRKGAMYAIKEDNASWVHAYCFRCIAELYHDDKPDDAVTVLGFPDAQAKRRTLHCSRCANRYQGVCVQCQHPNCYLAAHPRCALKSWQESIPSDVNKPIIFFCEKHMDDAEPKRSSESKRPPSSSSSQKSKRKHPEHPEPEPVSKSSKPSKMHRSSSPFEPNAGAPLQPSQPSSSGSTNWRKATLTEQGPVLTIDGVQAPNRIVVIFKRI
eukprot:c20509_g1_i5.p1 GENE.c20509_g1_i5~~c20509_g1_i5.p1  ORF type:complete len:265 (-),score=17.26 c20509_g1_i5:36-830(-)